ncbi:exopolyphosphatase [Microvirga sp. W0021]|uniref:exopolyphosphatase n=1 Tax=Hohaiivirga grylli TaxID=3133970 RepID=A0ABV0BIV7_9HYPH
MALKELEVLFKQQVDMRRDPALSKPIAIVDLGSNSVRLVVYEGSVRTPSPIYNEKMLCGLGRNVQITKKLPADGMEKALKALSRFRLICEQLQVQDIRVLATAAARDASNGPAFLAKAEKIIGRQVELISGEREAYLSGLGVISSFYKPNGIVGDLGGGSLELVEVDGMETGKGITMPLGGLALKDLSGNSVKKAQKIAIDTLKNAAPYLERLQGRRFYAVGGTWRAIAKLHQAQVNHPLHVMHGYLIRPNDSLSFLEMLEQAKTETLKDIDSISSARHQLLAYGAVVLEEIIRLGKPSEIIISANGVREGLLFEGLDEETKKIDPLLSVANDFNFARSRCPEHGHELALWTDRFIGTLALKETEYEQRLRYAACLLSDVSWRSHPDYRGEQSLNVIGHAATVGIDHPGRTFLALAVFFRFEGIAASKASTEMRELAGEQLFMRARLLAGLMRVAYTISFATKGILPQAPLAVVANTIVLQLPKHLEELNGERLETRMRQLGKLLKLETRIEII